MKSPKFKIGDILHSSLRRNGNNEIFMVVAYAISHDKPHYKVISLNDNNITHAGDHILLNQRITNMNYRKAA